MKKRVLILATVIFASGALHAQKGEKSLSVGAFLSLPAYENSYPSVKTGQGIEVNGQYGFTPKSSVVAQVALLHYPIERPSYFQNDAYTFVTIKGGYRYQLSPSGFYIHGLAGAEIDVSDSFTTIAFTLGGGKRFTFKNGRQLDVGLDLLEGDIAVSAVNIKAALLLFKKTSTR